MIREPLARRVEECVRFGQLELRVERLGVDDGVGEIGVQHRGCQQIPHVRNGERGRDGVCVSLPTA